MFQAYLIGQIATGAECREVLSRVSGLPYRTNCRWCRVQGSVVMCSRLTLSDELPPAPSAGKSVSDDISNAESLFLLLLFSLFLRAWTASVRAPS